MSNFALVLNSNKQPLNPIRPGAARRLLNAGKAAVYRMYPFTIILKSEVNQTPTPTALRGGVGGCHSITDQKQGLTDTQQTCVPPSGTTQLIPNQNSLPATFWWVVNTPSTNTNITRMCLPTLVTNPELEIASYNLEGYDCVIIHNGIGYLCGYIRVSSGHPWYQMDYASVDVEVHCGLTFAEADMPCDKAGPDNGWWLGFNCAHACDAPNPKLLFDKETLITLDHFARGAIRTEDYVRVEIAALVSQAQAAKIKMPQTKQPQ